MKVTASSLDGKSVYICGPLTDLPPELEPKEIKKFYEAIAGAAEEISKGPVFVPHQHFDPVAHVSFSPQEVYEAEKKQICEKTSCLIVVALAPSWGGGMEIEMANERNIPVVILREKGKRVSRLARGGPAVKQEIEYKDGAEALRKLRKILPDIFSNSAD